MVSRYTKGLLDTLLLRDNAKLVGEYPKFTAYTPITYICKCGAEYSKLYRFIVDNTGLFCKDCTKHKSKEKTEITTFEKYGVKHTMQKQEFKYKVIQTNMERRGVAHSLQDPKVRALGKETMMAILGVENPSQSQIIKNKKKETLMEHFGVDHNFKSPEIKEKKKATFMEHYGVENPFANKEIQEKIKEIHIEKRGVDNVMKDPKVKEKGKKTNMDKRGVEYSLQDPIVKEKGVKTNMDKRGVDNAMKDPEVKDKIKETNLLRYGTEYAMQNPDIQAKSQKNAYKFKPYTLPSGAQIKLQGYEPWALDKLLKIYTEDQIITDRSKVPYIDYTFNNKQKRYFPDIYIPHKNLIIEIKSTWTHKCKKEITLAKADATKTKGYMFEIWIFDAKGNRITS